MSGSSRAHPDCGDSFVAVESATEIGDCSAVVALLRDTTDGLWEWNLRTRRVCWSDQLLDTLGLPPGSPSPSFAGVVATVHPEDRRPFCQAIRSHFREGRPYRIEFRARRADGRYVWLLALGRAELDARGRPIRLMGSIRDITERSQSEAALRRAHAGLERRVAERTRDLELANAALSREVQTRRRTETALRESERLARGVVDAIGSSIAILDERGAIVAVNRAWRLLAERRRGLGGSHGQDPDVGVNYLEFCDRITGPCRHDARAMAEGIRRVIDRGLESFRHEYSCAVDGDEHWFIGRVDRFDSRGAARVVVWHDDITERHRSQEERHRLQAELAHVARLSTLGAMAAGLAHELNQPLGAITNYAQSALACLHERQPDDPLIEPLDQIGRLALRAGQIIQRVRQLVRKRPHRQSSVHLNPLIHEVLLLIQHEARVAGIAVELRLSDRLPPVAADSVQVQQVILNLARNAIDALTQVHDRPRVLSIASALIAQDHAPRRVRVEVRDNGPGLRPDEAQRLFIPFHTTKPQGMGLGLSLSRTIAESHGGELDLIPVPPPGCCFRFDLPAMLQEP